MRNEQEIAQRRRELALEEIAGGKIDLYYISFADDGGFLGAVFVKAQGPSIAHRFTHILGINPGGSVAITKIWPEWPQPAETYLNRLLTKQELETAMGPLVDRLGNDV